MGKPSKIYYGLLEDQPLTAPLFFQQGETVTTTANGDAGGGGSGLIRNITFKNFDLTNVGLPIQITQCIYTEGTTDTCETSKMQIEDVTWENFTGTSTFNVAASLHCAASHPCPDIYFKDINITSINSTLALPLYNTTLQKEVFQCANIINENVRLLHRRYPNHCLGSY